MDIKTRLKAHHFHFKKKFGQNFITDTALLSKIARVLPLSKEDVVLEIGAGAGTLTIALADRAREVVAIEIDRSLLPILEEMAVGRSISLVSGDALKFDLDQLIFEKTQKENYKIIANLPYYITTPLIMHALENASGAKEIAVMVQKEVSDRLRAKPSSKAYGAISVMVQYLSQVEEAFFVSRKSFFPVPEVDSAVITLKRYDDKPYLAKDEKVFRKVVKASFSQRRKTLKNGLKSLGLSNEVLDTVFLKVGIDKNIRGENLSVGDFVALADAFYEEGLR